MLENYKIWKKFNFGFFKCRKFYNQKKNPNSKRFNVRKV